MITDEGIIEEAIRLVGEGVSVTLPVNGNSMLPFIIGGKESVILQKPFDRLRDRTVGEPQSTVGEPVEPRVGDVVLAWVKGGYYVVHRIIAIGKGQPTDGALAERLYTLMGDGNLSITEQCTTSDIKALVTHVVSADGRRHEIDNLWRRNAARLWWHLRPIRRYLLALYRKIVN